MFSDRRLEFVTSLILLLLLSISCADLSGIQQEQMDDGGWTQASIGTLTDRQMPAMPSKVISFETSEGTFMSVDVSPGGESLTFDLLGDLYLLPIGGGAAAPLTSGRAWDQAPRFSPDGTSVYFISDRKGYKNIWRVVLSDRSVHQVTASESDFRGTPNWSQDGTRLIAGHADITSNREVTLQSINADTGEITPLERPDGPARDMDTYRHFRDTILTYSGVQAADGSVYFSEAKSDPEIGRRVVRVLQLDPETQIRRSLTPNDARYNEFKPQLSHNGQLLAYFRQYEDRRTELRILNRETGRNKAVIELSDADDASYAAKHDLWPNYAFTPDDRHIVFWQDGKIHRVTLADGASEIIPFRAKVVREVWQRVRPAVQTIDETAEAKIIRWPSLSQDGETIVFAAIGYVWIMDGNTGKIRRLTQSSDFEYMPSLSPDGRSVAYISFAELKDGYGPARLMVTDISGGTSKELLTATNGVYLLPNWSVDGDKIALIREISGDIDEGGIKIETMFGWTEVDKGAFREVASAPASGSFASLFFYTRYVGFDQTGQRLIFSYPTSREKTALATATLDSSTVRTLAIGTSVHRITPAPDLKYLALTTLTGTVWIVPFEVGEGPIEVSTVSADARPVSEGTGYYVAWNDPEQITYSLSQNLYRYDLDESNLVVRTVKVKFDKPTPTQPIAFKGARLITMSGNTGAGHVIESGTIVLEGQRISAIGSAGDVEVASDALVIDATGKTIIPGLLDTHYHRIGGSGGSSGASAYKLPNSDFQDRSAIAYGVTTAWEPGGVASDGSPATADLQVAGRIRGPRWSHSAVGSVGRPYNLQTYDAVLAAVRQHKTLGVTTLKEVNTPTREQRQWLSIAARDQGVGIVSHIDHFDGMMCRVVDGYTGGDHPYIPVPFFKDVEELLRQTGYIWTPNIVITPGTVGAGAYDKSSYYLREVLVKRPNELIKLNRITGYNYEKAISEPSVPYELHRVSRVAEAAAAAAKGGAYVGVSGHNMPASTLHREMWYLWKGGLPIEDVLRATTIGNAEKLGLQEEIGSLERGKIADFIVLDENPLDDILNTLSLKYTVQGGVVYDSDTGQRVDVSALAEHPTDVTVH